MIKTDKSYKDYKSYKERKKILFLSPVQPLLTPGNPLPRWQMQASWVRALTRAGHEVRVVKYTPDDRIRLNWGERIWWNIRVIREIREIGGADLIIYSLGADVLLPWVTKIAKMSENRETKLVVLSGVSPIKQGNPRERSLAALVDLAATNDESHAREWLELGAKRAAVLPIAGVDPELHYPRFLDDPRRAGPRYHFLDTLGQEPSLTASSPPGQSKTKVLSGSSSIVSKMTSSGQLQKILFLRDIDVVFVGTLTEERKKFFKKLRRLVPDKVKIVVKEFVWEEEYAGLMSRAKIGVNLLRPEMERGVNLRAFEIPAFGAMEITGFSRKEWLTPGKEVEVFSSAEEAAGLVKKYLKDDRARQKIAAAGRKRVMREHTFDERVKRLIEIVDNPRRLVRDESRRHFLDTLGQEPSLTSSSPPGQSETKVLSGSSSIVSKMPSLTRLKNIPSSPGRYDYHITRVDVSVCIVNYMADEELRRCLESVKKFTKGVSYEIIVIDNSKDNRWYSGGNNLALKQAGGRYVLFLNPDCWLTNDLMSQLADFMDKHPQAGTAEPRQVYENGEIAPTGSLAPRWWIDAVEMTGLSGLFGRLGKLGKLGRLGRLGKFGELDKYRQIQFDRKQNFKTDVISGAAMMVRKEILDEVGGFDERLKLYYTDTDLCRRIRRAGWEIWHAGEIWLRHKTRGSTSKLPWDRLNLIYAADGKEYYRKWGEGMGGKILYWAMRGNEMLIKIKQVDPRRHFFGTLGQEPSLTSSSPLGQNPSRVLSGSSSMTSKMAPSDQLRIPVELPKLTAIVICRSKRDGGFKRALASVKFADEVLVVERREISDWAAVRNEAVEKARGEWVMFVDSDEEVSESLAMEIIRTLLAVRQGESLQNTNGFYFKRRDRFLGKWLKHGETASVGLLRLAKKGAERWERPVHEVWKVRGRVLGLKHPIWHYSHESVDEMVEKLGRYSEMEADYRLGRLGELGKFGKLGVLGEMAIFPAGKFVFNYFLRLGFLDGMEGLIHALMMSGHSFLVRAKLWERM